MKTKTKSIILFTFVNLFAFIIFISFTFKQKPKPGFGLSYEIEFKAGHPGNNCHGCAIVGIPIFATPTPVHLPCWSYGSECTHKFKVEFGFKPGSGNTEVDHVNLDLLNEQDVPTLALPSRSVKINDLDGNHYFLNIPEQMISVMNFNIDQNTIYLAKNYTITELPIY